MLFLVVWSPGTPLQQQEVSYLVEKSSPVSLEKQNPLTRKDPWNLPLSNLRDLEDSRPTLLCHPFFPCNPTRKVFSTVTNNPSQTTSQIVNPPPALGPPGNETEKGTRQPCPFPSLRPAWAGRLLDRPWGGAELPGSKAHSRNSFWETNTFQVWWAKTVILQKCPLKLIRYQHENENKDNLTSFVLFSDQVSPRYLCKRECLQCIP